MRYVQGHNVVWHSLDFSQMSDDFIECNRDLPKMRMLCAEYCVKLRLTPPVTNLSQHIATNLISYAGCRLLHKGMSQSELSAVSIYVASHLVGQPVSQRAFQCLMRENPGADVHALSRYVRSECYTVVSRTYTETYGLQLNWDCFQNEDHEMDEFRQQRLRVMDVVCKTFKLTNVA